MVAEDPLGEVKKAIVAVGKLPAEVCGSGAEQYFDGAEVDFEVKGTGFIYVHTPLEFAESRSDPDPETGTVYYWAMIWIVTCKHCVPETGVAAVRVNTTHGSTRNYEEVDRLQRKLIVRYANEQIRQINKLSVSSNWMRLRKNRRNRTASEGR